MLPESELIGTDIDAYLAQHARKELVRFLTCGSVDDGKSTLIGRLLFDTAMIYEDQLAAVKKESARKGNAHGELDLSLLTDGLRAEREQRITIDVAYRYFSTPHVSPSSPTRPGTSNTRGTWRPVPLRATSRSF